MAKHKDYQGGIIERNLSKINRQYGPWGIVFVLIIGAVGYLYYDKSRLTDKWVEAMSSQVLFNEKLVQTLGTVSERVQQNTDRLNENKKDMEHGLHTVDENHEMLKEIIQRSK